MAQPTITPEYKSRTTHKYSQCSAVRTYVMSVTHFVLGAVAVKSRSKWLRVPAGGVPDGLVRQRRRCGTPRKPARRIRRATRCRRRNQHGAAESGSGAGRSPGSAHSAPAPPSRHTRWPTPVNTDTSSGWETRRGIVGSADTSLRRSREERCRRFSQKIPLLREPSQLPTELAHLFIPGSPIAHEGWLGGLAQLASPPPLDIRSDA